MSDEIFMQEHEMSLIAKNVFCVGTSALQVIPILHIDCIDKLSD